jgi:hypothetical protein
MTQTLQIPNAPTVIEIPDLTQFSDLQLADYAIYIAEVYTTKDSFISAREAIRNESYRRIKSMLSDNNFNNWSYIKMLAEAYAVGVCGCSIKGCFSGPRHIWGNKELEDQVRRFFFDESTKHSFINTATVLDYLDLLTQRLTKEG